MSFSMQSAWDIILSAERFSNTDISKTVRAQYASWKSTQHMGRALPFAVHPGERTIEPFIFETAADALEQLSGKLISERA
ncbi:hypothetical protein [Oceanidesulfovibrio marinus]|uniref:Uncharacterized protein n=1 Tax=Oceanidesulfovibrio marinus TaxID=370038 RepID=A0A6P1ZFS1_9BACT|nr:hypothetical protein [Oceanidesulfovibrio marinus]QJT08511.1 hypothetical protein E8L03_06040 [Oceanidesulfovibrio marinus]TVM33021.1 hypothetical protein DQK91_12710 [Oceanidesulfovibrio marinus]